MLDLKASQLREVHVILRRCIPLVKCEPNEHESADFKAPARQTHG